MTYFEIFKINHVEFPLVLVAPEDRELRPKHMGLYDYLTIIN
jgi:hypothetical protein